MLTANIMWGLMSPLGKDAMNSPDLSPLTLAGLRVIGAAVLFWLASLVLPQSIAPKEHIDKRDWKHLVGAAMFIIVANQMLIIFGVSLTSPIDATVMCSTTPFFTLLLVALLWHVKHPMTRIIGVLIGFAGILVFIVGTKSDASMHVSNPLLGDTCIILSQVCGAIYMVCYAFLTKRYSPFTLMKWLFTIAAIVMIAVSGKSIITTQWTVIPMSVLVEAGYVVVCGTFLAYVLLPIGQRVLMPTAVAMYNYLQPIVAAAFSLLIGVAAITMNTVLATALIFLGVALVNKTKQ